jgi:hypothetical protein
LRELVPFANHLAEVTGSRATARRVAQEIGQSGLTALPRVGGDLRLVLEEQARVLGLINADGSGDGGRCGQLVVVCDILSDVPPRPDPPDPPKPLVYTVPSEARGLIEPRQRLDLLVERVVRMATAGVHIGGPFWNDPGFERLLRVLLPAVRERSVQCSFYVHSWPDRDRQDFLRDRISQVGHPQHVTTWWYRGPAESLMHAKFVVGDGCAGYLGTANLTSYGMEQHVEMGLELGQEQAVDLLGFLQALINAGLFAQDPPATSRINSAAR